MKAPKPEEPEDKEARERGLSYCDYLIILFFVGMIFALSYLVFSAEAKARITQDPFLNVMATDYYSILGLTPEASPQLVHHRYNEINELYNCSSKMQGYARAYQSLSNEANRTHYNQVSTPRSNR